MKRCRQSALFVPQAIALAGRIVSMRYRLRTLLIVLGVVPPALAGVWFLLPHWIPVTCFLVVLWLTVKTATTLERLGRPRGQIAGREESK